MRSAKARICSLTFTVALTTIGVAAVTTTAAAPAHAATSTGDGTAPSDCTFTRLDGGVSAAFTCTSRPPTQMWHILTLCNWHVMTGTVVAGNEVTGNGTSTADCGSNIVAASFIIDS
jgi:hypothetical protein